MLFKSIQSACSMECWECRSTSTKAVRPYSKSCVGGIVNRKVWGHVAWSKIEIKSYWRQPSRSAVVRLLWTNASNNVNAYAAGNAEEADAGIKALEGLALHQGGDVGLFREHLEWQGAGLAEYV